MTDVAAPDERTFQVTGMSCDHCVAAVEGAVSALDGVASVQVALVAGEVVVVGGDEASIRAAIEDEGYDVA